MNVLELIVAYQPS